MFYVESESTGEELSKGYVSLEEAVDEAKRLLEDDPEQGELQVIHYTVERIVRFGPDANWDTQIVVLKPGEKLQPPPSFGGQIEDQPGFQGWRNQGGQMIPIWESGYDPSDPKHPDWHSVHTDIWDSRAGK